MRHHEIIDKALREKFAEIRQEGFAEGMERRNLEIAKIMSTQGYTLEQISQVTNLSITDIKSVLD